LYRCVRFVHHLSCVFVVFLCCESGCEFMPTAHGNEGCVSLGHDVWEHITNHDAKIAARCKMCATAHVALECISPWLQKVGTPRTV
jgi:hypothetical protein